MVRYPLNMIQTNEYFREYAKKHRERRREIVRLSSSRPEYKNARKEYMKQWSLENKDKVIANRKKWAERHRTRQITKDAIKAGKIKREPCEVCGNKKSEAHHHDYSKPFLLSWLCKKHHTLHRRLS